MRFSTLLALTLSVLCAAVSASARTLPCTDPRFLVDGIPVVAGATAGRNQPVAIANGQVSIGDACAPTALTIKTTRRGTVVRARWARCAGMRGTVRLEGTVSSDCSRLHGRLRCPKDKPRRRQFTARRSTCGDRVVDAGAGEECDRTACGDGSACSDECTCPSPAPTTTVPVVVTSTTTTVVTVPTTSTLAAVTTTTAGSTTTTTEPPGPSVARRWDEAILSAIRRDTPRPTVHSRNLFHLSAAMWDAWAAYDPVAAQYFVAERATADDVPAARREAISFAAHRILSARYAHAFGAAQSLAGFDALLAELGYDENFTSTDGASPAALGNRIAAAVLTYGATDGANEGATHTYADPTYTPVNRALIVKFSNPVPFEDAPLPIRTPIDPNRWQPLALDFFITQNGIPEPISEQKFIGSHWGQVKPFALIRQDPNDVYSDPGVPPYLGDQASHGLFRDRVVEIIQKNSELDPNDPETIDISPAVRGNNTLGTNDGTGYDVNPVTGQPYAPNVVKRGDFGRVLAEYWADGPTSETPPGHWNVVANTVTDALAPEQKRYGGTGPMMSALEWDVKLYFTLNAAVHDAAIACWDAKRKYDYVRPITMVRYMAWLGQASDPSRPSYHPNGLPLVPGLIEEITEDSVAPGERHEHLNQFVGEIAVRGWPGQPAVPRDQVSGVRWLWARRDWVPFQRNTFVTPAFAAYTSGHSTFSRASAEVLTAFTGTPYFPGGLGTFIATRDVYLAHEKGPSETVVLQWATYYDAADDAGLSRLFGGIHVAGDDFGGREMGHRIGLDVVERARRYFDGTVLD